MALQHLSAGPRQGGKDGLWRPGGWSVHRLIGAVESILRVGEEKERCSSTRGLSRRSVGAHPRTELEARGSPTGGIHGRAAREVANRGG